MFKILALTIAAITSTSLMADELPFDTFAYKVIAEGFQTSDSIQLREGARRCGGAMILANHLGWVDDPAVAGSDANLGYRGISTASLSHWFTTTQEGEVIPEAIQNQRYEEELYYREYGEIYRSWLEGSDAIDREAFMKSMADVNGLTPMQKLPERHPFSIELRKCYEIGLELHNYFSQ